VKIAIGTLRNPKVAAVKSTLEKISRYLVSENESVEYWTKDVQSDISKMPVSIHELIQGAYNRVHNLILECKNSESLPNYFVGLEGGFFQQKLLGESLTFLQCWVYVSDGANGYFGASGVIPVPKAIVYEVIERKKELGDLIDCYAHVEGVRDKQGAFGVFTNGLLTRKLSFEIALISAFAPFFNRKVYK